jgi:hypothetical protein
MVFGVPTVGAININISELSKPLIIEYSAAFNKLRGAVMWGKERPPSEKSPRKRLFVVLIYLCVLCGDIFF